MINNILVKKIHFHRHVLIEITKKCNLKCLHCFTNGGASLQKELSLAEWEIVASDLVKNGFNAFTISGGEPLLDVDKTIGLINAIKRNNQKAKIYLFTNGFFISTNFIKRIKNNISGMGTSIDGNQETHDWLRGVNGSYTQAINALTLLKKENTSVFIQSMVTPQTLPHIEEVVKLAVNKKVKAVRFSHVDYYGRGKENKNIIGMNNDGLIALDKKIIKMKKVYNVYITTNLVYKENLRKRPEDFFIPNLHILPDGIVLPWYGFPSDYALWKYPEITLDNVSDQLIYKQLQKFHNLLNQARKAAFDKATRVLAFDNIIAELLTV